MINDFLVLIIIALLISNIFYVRKEYKRKRRKKYSYGNKEHYNVTNATSKANYQTFKAIERRLDTQISRIIDRIDKLEVDTAYIENFTIKQEETTTSIIPNPKDVKNEPLGWNKLLKGQRNKSTKGKKQSKLFSNEQIDLEMRKVIGDVLFLSPSDYTKEYKKAYSRLYYKSKKNKK